MVMTQQQQQVATQQRLATMQAMPAMQGSWCTL
jgi:hypothetical protein